MAFTTLSAVSAEDSTADVLENASCDDLSAADEGELESADEIEVLEADDGTFTALQNKISSAKDGSTITLEKDYVYNNGTDEGVVPIISRSLTINGNGHVIDGASQSALLRVLGKINVVINDVTFVNGNDNEVIRVDYNKYLEMNRCTFTNNSGYFGGALLMTNITSTSFNDCYFADNQAQYGGAICFLNYENTHFTDCTFFSNNAHQNGGALYFENGKKSQIKNCAFSENIAVGHGGAVGFTYSSDCEIDSSYFESNYALYGGAVDSNLNNINIQITSCNFTKHYAFYGGALYFLTSDSFKVYSCNFNNNQAVNSSSTGGAGAAMYIAQSYGADVSYCNFNENYATIGGGSIAIHSSNNNNFNRCTFNENYAPGGGAVFDDSSSIFNKCVFTGNFVRYLAGAMYGGIAIDCTFKDNTEPATYGTQVLSSVKLTVKQSGSDCDDKTVTATLKNANDGSVIANQYVKLDINGKTTKVKTNSKGQAVFKVNVPSKSYTATVSLDKNTKYVSTSAKVSVTVKKATPKLSASKKTFKVKTKTKKYTVTLKNKKGNAIKSVWVTINVKNKTYNIKTNSKGQAIFKLKLTKKGNYKSTVKFSGNGYYNSVTKKVTIYVK